MKSALWFGAKFLLITIPLTYLFLEAGGKEFYVKQIFRPAARAVYDLLGAETVRAPARERYINLIPFVALMLLTPAITWQRRLAGLGIGLAVLFLSHIAINWALYETRALTRAFLRVFSDTLPFFLWAAINPQFVTRVARHVMPGGAETSSESEPE